MRTVFEVSEHGDYESVHALRLVPDGVEVEQCLRRVLSDTVASI